MGDGIDNFRSRVYVCPAVGSHHASEHFLMLAQCRSLLRCAAALSVIAGVHPLGAQVRIKLAAWQESVLMDTLRQEHDVDAPADRVYQAALQAFADLDIPTGHTDGTKGIIGSERFERARSLGGAAMSRSFSCGDAATGPKADQLRLEIAIAVWVKPSDTRSSTGSTVGIATVASGRDVSGVSGRPQGCTSTGGIETKILDRVKKIVAAQSRDEGAVE